MDDKFVFENMTENAVDYILNIAEIRSDQCILAVDTGLLFGYALINDQKQIIAGGFLNTRPNIYEAAFKLVSHLIMEYSPRLAYIEKAFINPNIPTAQTTIEQRGAVKACLQLNGIPFNEANSAQVRSLLHIKGKATDSIVRQVITSILEIPIEYVNPVTNRPKKLPADFFDAVALAYYAYNQN